MKYCFLIALLVFLSGCFGEVRIEHDGYDFSFPMTIKTANSLFSLNEKIPEARIARLNSEGCKEVQITHVPGIKDSSYKNQVEAVSFYHTESLDSLKNSLERTYGDTFEPVCYYRSDRVHYYLMHLSGFVIILYPTNFRACVEEPTLYGQPKRSDMSAVVAFTPLLTEKNEFDAFVTLDGLWRE